MPSGRKPSAPSTLIPYKCCGCISETDLRLQSLKNGKTPLNITRNDGPYLDHLHRLKSMKSMIENKWPPKNRCSHSKNHSKQVAENRIREENTTIWTTINGIMSSKSHMDTRNPMAGQHLDEYQLASKAMADRIDKENRELYERLARIGPTMKNAELKADWSMNLHNMAEKCKYPLILPGLVPPAATMFKDDCRDKYRPRAFIDISVRDGRKLGQISLVLYVDIVPRTVNNFMELLKNYQRQQQANIRGERKKFTHYVGSSVYRIFRQLWVEMGDMTLNNGLGGCSADGEDFEAENFDADYNQHAGMLAMVPDAYGKVNSKFLLTLKPLKVLNGKRVCFGRVLQGLDVLDVIEKQARGNGKPTEALIISNCGVLKPKRKRRDE